MSLTRAERNYAWKAQRRITLADLRTLVASLEKIGCIDEQVVHVIAHDDQREGYSFYASVTIPSTELEQ